MLYSKIVRCLLKKRKTCIIPFTFFVFLIKRIINKIAMNVQELYYVNFFNYKITIVPPFYTKIEFDFYDDDLIDQELQLIYEKYKHLDEFDYELRIFEYLTKNLKYDNNYEKDSFSILNPLFKGYGVCEGFSTLFSALCYKKRIKCLKRTGKLNNQPHMWNVIKIKNKLYNVDVTAGISLYEKRINFAYINMPDYLLMDYEIEGKMKLTNLVANPYVIYNLVFKDEKELVDRIAYFSKLKSKIILLNLSQNNVDYTNYLLSCNFNFDFQFLFIDRYVLINYYHN